MVNERREKGNGKLKNVSVRRDRRERFARSAPSGRGEPKV
jgi:hypothetical protein